MWLLTKCRSCVWAGAALLGWIAGELIVTDPGHEAVSPRVVAQALGISDNPRRVQASIGAALGAALRGADGAGADSRRRTRMMAQPLAALIASGSSRAWKVRTKKGGA